MTDGSQARPPTPANDLLDKLRREILDEESTSTVSSESGSGIHGELAALIFQATQQPVVVGAVDSVLADQEGLPTRDFQLQTSQKVAAALGQRRRSLPALLELRRIETGRSAAEVAGELGIPEDRLYALEVGRLPLWEASPSDAVRLVTEWIRALKVDANSAARAARRLIPSQSVPAYARRDESGRRPAAERFVAELLKAIGP